MGLKIFFLAYPAAFSSTQRLQVRVDLFVNHHCCSTTNASAERNEHAVTISNHIAIFGGNKILFVEGQYTGDSSQIGR